MEVFMAVAIRKIFASRHLAFMRRFLERDLKDPVANARNGRVAVDERCNSRNRQVMDTSAVFFPVECC